jgi:hypothetical protein
MGRGDDSTRPPGTRGRILDAAALARLTRVVRASLCCSAALALAATAGAAEIPGAVLVLEVTPAALPAGQYRDALPPRFVLMEKGQVFVGGTSLVATGRLESAEARALEARVEVVKKIRGLGPQVTFGAGTTRYRLLQPGKRAFEVVATGDPEAAPGLLQPLGALVAQLAAFHHETLRPYRPESFALLAREAALPGGCRPWSFPLQPQDALAGPRSVPASAAVDWPTGAVAASVCAGDKRYAVTLRPLLPGERP